MIKTYKVPDIDKNRIPDIKLNKKESYECSYYYMDTRSQEFCADYLM